MFFVRHLAQATKKDLKSIQAMAHIIWHATYNEILPEGQTAYMLEELFNLPTLEQRFEEGADYFIAEIDHEPVGFAEILPLEEGTTKLSKIYILPRYQGKGLGKKLLHACEKLAKIRGSNKILLNVNRHNKAYTFYEAMGYHILKEVDIPIGPYEMNDYVMERELT